MPGLDPALGRIAANSGAAAIEGSLLLRLIALADDLIARLRIRLRLGLLLVLRLRLALVALVVLFLGDEIGLCLAQRQCIDIIC